MTHCAIIAALLALAPMRVMGPCAPRPQDPFSVRSASASAAAPFVIREWLWRGIATDINGDGNLDVVGTTEVIEWRNDGDGRTTRLRTRNSLDLRRDVDASISALGEPTDEVTLQDDPGVPRLEVERTHAPPLPRIRPAFAAELPPTAAPTCDATSSRAPPPSDLQLSHFTRSA